MLYDLKHLLISLARGLRYFYDVELLISCIEGVKVAQSKVKITTMEAFLRTQTIFVEQYIL